MNIGKAFTEFHFNIILNQDARIYTSLGTALDIFSNKPTAKVFPVLIFIFSSYSTLFLFFHHILPCFYLSIIFYLVFISFPLQFHTDHT